MVTAGILPFRENSRGRTGNRTRDLMISSQRLWPLDHEAGQLVFYIIVSKMHGHTKVNFFVKMPEAYFCNWRIYFDAECRLNVYKPNM